MPYIGPNYYPDASDMTVYPTGTTTPKRLADVAASSGGGLFVGTYATRAALATAYPPATTAVGSYALVGTTTGRAFLVNNGIAWTAPTQSLAESGVGVPLTGTTSGTLLATAKVPGGVMGANGMLRITAYWSMTNNANTKTMLIRYGSALTSFFQAGLSSVPAAGFQGFIANVGAIGSQKMNGTGTGSSYGTFANAFNTASENSDADQNITFTGVLGNSADTITLEAFNVELVS